MQDGPPRPQDLSCRCEGQVRWVKLPEPKDEARGYLNSGLVQDTFLPKADWPSVVIAHLPMLAGRRASCWGTLWGAGTEHIPHVATVQRGLWPCPGSSPGSGVGTQAGRLCPGPMLLPGLC